MRFHTLCPADFCTALATEHDLAVTLTVGKRVPSDWVSGTRCLEDHVLYLVERGAIAGSAGGRSIRVTAGEVLWTPAGLKHDYQVAARCTDCHSLRFRLRRAGTCLRPLETTLLVTSGAAFRQAFAGIEATPASPLGTWVRRGHLLALTAGLLASAAPRPGALDDEDVARLRQLTARHAARAVSSADLARELGYHPAHFARRFSATFGISPRRWLVEERLRGAAGDLVASDEPVAIVAARWGWSDPKLFSRLFARAYQRPPSAWRRRW